MCGVIRRGVARLILVFNPAKPHTSRFMRPIIPSPPAQEQRSLHPRDPCDPRSIPLPPCGTAAPGCVLVLTQSAGLPAVHAIGGQSPSPSGVVLVVSLWFNSLPRQPRAGGF